MRLHPFLRLRALLLSCLLAPLALWANDETPLTSRITEVSVFRQRAQIVRTAQTNVRKGENLLVFTGLSRHILPNSITVSGTGKGIIQAVTHRVSYLNTTPKTPRMQAIEDSVEWLQAELQVLADEQFVRQSEEKLLLENGKIGGDETGLNPEALIRVATLYQERLSALRKEMRDLSRQKVRYERRIAAYQQELNQIRAQRNQPTQEVLVAFRADQAGSLSLELRYLVNQAGWNPFYDIRVEATDQPLQFFLKADVVNNTGIDWNGVKLTLSTTNNNVNNTQPVLSPWYVDISYPRPVPQPAYAPRRESRRDATTANTMAGIALDEMEEDAPEATYAYDYTTTTEGELGLEFAIALPYDIPADNKPHQVDIQVIPVKGSFRHYAVPKLDRDAFLVAQISQDLLRGKGNVYFEGTFVGETYVNTDNPRDSMLVSLGRDPKVQVQREQVAEFTERKTIGSNERLTYGFAITLRNNKSTAVQLTLEDQVPVSQNKEIEVEILELSGGRVDPGSGKVVWDVALAPGETRELILKFEVKYPKNQPVSGL
ncbi:MAG: mucoidy inhibitor MuiA family protein [Bacteroidetes bacterium]|nr:MAG: mucoidy inhibitor MuiA family protein [Bacteroidota bacterium]